MMSEPLLHHGGLRVADADRACVFYRDALGGRQLTRPVVLEGRGAEQVIGVSGARLRVALIAFGEGAIELFELMEPAVPDWGRAPVQGTIPHLALQVDDVEATLARAEAAGGRRLWPAVDRFGRSRAIYLADPDGNVVELLDGSVADIAAAFLKWFPDAAPESQGASS
jgi:catechol 2,3-dioxygenase-like lactoylglutathione lyase family enzyme